MIKKEFIKNAVAVSAVSVIMSTVGIAFRTYASNRVGSEVMGLLQLVLSVYYPACTLASSGIYVASTRLCSEALARGDRSAGRILSRCIVYGLSFGVGAFLLLFFGAESIALHWLQYPQAETPLKILSFALPFLSTANALQGFFLSLQKATYSTFLQVTEDLSKIGATVLLFSLFLNRGPQAALCAMTAGMAAGEILSCLGGYLLYRRTVLRIDRGRAPRGTSLHEIAVIALPCAFSGYLRSGIGMVESILVPRGLEASGLTEEQTLAALGKFEGMALPVLIFPAAFLVSVSKLLVPEISAKNATGKTDGNLKTTQSALRYTLIYAVFIAVFTGIFGRELGLSLFGDETCGGYISLLAPLVPVLYCDRIADGIMKGYNKQLDTMKINLAEALFQTAGAWLIIPKTGIGGYIALFAAGTVLNFFFSFRALKKTCPVRFPVREGILRPLRAALAAVLPLKLLRKLYPIPVWAAAGAAIPLFLFFLKICADGNEGIGLTRRHTAHGGTPTHSGRRRPDRLRRKNPLR